jgi:hypothetical protein
MTNEKIGAVDKIAIEPLLGSEAGRRWRARRSFQLFAVSALARSMG